MSDTTSGGDEGGTQKAPCAFGVVLAAVLVRVNEAAERGDTHEVLLLMVAAGQVAQRALLAEGLVTVDANSGN